MMVGQASGGAAPAAMHVDTNVVMNDARSQPLPHARAEKNPPARLLLLMTTTTMRRRQRRPNSSQKR